MSILKEFRDFAMKGNVLDLAIAVIIGGAFGKIVSSLVDDVITPLLLNPALEALGAKNIEELAFGSVKYGNFLASVINFFFIALVMFSLVKAMNSLKKKEIAPAPTPEKPSQEELLTQIRDILAKK